MRKGRVFVDQVFAGEICEAGDGFTFTYDPAYLQNASAKPVSLTLPLSTAPYRSPTLFPFFDGLIPEGWLLDVSIKNWKLNPRDRMGLLLCCCRDSIGNVSVEDDSDAL